MSIHSHQQYPISDLYGWIKNKELTLAPEFQRGETWTASAISFFIDTLLRDLPIPPVYIRLVTDTDTKTSYREVVDGQQRLSAIVKFIDGQLVLDKRSKEFHWIYLRLARRERPEGLPRIPSGRRTTLWS